MRRLYVGDIMNWAGGSAKHGRLSLAESHGNLRHQSQLPKAEVLMAALLHTQVWTVKVKYMNHETGYPAAFKPGPRRARSGNWETSYPLTVIAVSEP